MRRLILHFALFSALLVGIGLLIAASGLYNVASSVGHFAITAWFLDLTMRQSVRMWAWDVKLPQWPDLDKQATIIRGASHYELGCASCHGRATDDRGSTVKHMTPPPPFLADYIDGWKARELFWIVKHGIKYTAMPAWVAQSRDDEVWAVVAFLLRLPEIDKTAYAELAFGRETDPRVLGPAVPAAVPIGQDGSVLALCERCHGLDGIGRGDGAFPRLAGQSETYLYESLRSYASGERFSGVMQPLAALLTEGEKRRLAAYYAQLQGAPPVGQDNVDNSRLRLGASLATNGVPDRGIPACDSCHEPSAKTYQPLFPKLAGQDAGYIRLQLRLLQAGARGGIRTNHAHFAMKTIADRLSPEEIDAATLHYSTYSKP